MQRRQNSVGRMMTLKVEEQDLAEEQHPEMITGRTTEAQMTHMQEQDHAHKEKEEEKFQEIDIGMTTETHQETGIEIEDMKTEEIVEKEAMKKKGRKGPAMADQGDPVEVARSPQVMGVSCRRPHGMDQD